MRQSFEIEGSLDGLNEYTKANRSGIHAGAKMKRANQDAVSRAIRTAGLKPMGGSVAVTIVWIEGIRPGRRQFRPRDRDNIRFAAKFILDALVETGIIADDSWNRVLSVTDRFLLNRNGPRIIVEVEEVPDA